LAVIFAAIGEAAAAAFATLTGDAQAAAALVRNAFEAAAQTIAAAWTGAMDDMRGATQDLVSAVESLIGRLESRLASLRSEIARARAEASGGGSGFASGGYISGPGTATSDSIPAWLSAGEFVIRAAAVDRIGLPFLRMLNSARFSLGDLFARLPSLKIDVARYAAAFDPPRRAYAAGGLVAAMASAGGQPVILSIDGQHFAGFSGAPDAVRQVGDFLNLRARLSNGRKPGWYGG
jgi:hypothetical protein